MIKLDNVANILSAVNVNDFLATTEKKPKFQYLRFVSGTNCFKIKINVLDIALTLLFREQLVSVLAVPENNEKQIERFVKDREKYLESSTCTCY